MNMNSPSITLKPVSNGWLVQLPPCYDPIDPEDRILSLASKVRDLQERDPLLDKLQNQANELEEEMVPRPSLLEIIKDPFTHIFPDLPAALSFIRESVTKPPAARLHRGGSMGMGINI